MANETTHARGPKLNAEVVKLSELEAGESVKGKYLGSAVRPWVDHQTGATKELTSHVFEKLDKTGERFSVFEDAGLRSALAASLVKEGQRIEIVKGEQVALGGGKRVNTYDVYPLN